MVACDVRTTFVDAAERFAPQKGASLGEVRLLHARLERLVDVYLEQYGVDVRELEGSGAAGGLAGGLAAIGAELVPGFDVVAEAIDLAQTIAAADLVITGEGAFDFSSRAGKVPYGVAHVAAEALRPCIALAGQVLVGSREMRALGIESAYSVVDLLGEERAFGDPAGALADLSARVARTWGGRRTQE